VAVVVVVVVVWLHNVYDLTSRRLHVLLACWHGGTTGPTHCTIRRHWAWNCPRFRTEAWCCENCRNNRTLYWQFLYKLHFNFWI